MLLLGGLCTAAQANGSFRDCPASPVAATHSNGDSVSPFELIWDIDDGTTSVAPGEQLSLLFAAPLASDSGCQIEGEVEFYDGLGAPLGEPQTVHLPPARFQDFLLSYNGSTGGRGIVGYRARGTLTGCTVDEAASFAVTESQLDPSGQTAVSMSRIVNNYAIGGYGDAGTPDYIATPEMRERKVDLACRSAAAAGYHDPVSPFDLIWDIDGGTTTQAAGGKSELLIFVTPRIMRCERRNSHGRVVDFLPKVKIEAVVDDSLGNRFTDVVEVDAESPSAVLSYPYMGTEERVYQSFRVTAKMPACQTGRPYDMVVKLYQVGAGDETLTSRALGGVRYKVPPPRFEYNGDGTVKP